MFATLRSAHVQLVSQNRTLPRSSTGGSIVGVNNGGTVYSTIDHNFQQQHRQQQQQQLRHKKGGGGGGGGDSGCLPHSANCPLKVLWVKIPGKKMTWFRKPYWSTAVIVNLGERIVPLLCSFYFSHSKLQCTENSLGN